MILDGLSDLQKTIKQLARCLPGPLPDMPFNPTFTVKSDMSSPGEQGQHVRGGAESSLLCGISLLCQFMLKKKKGKKGVALIVTCLSTPNLQSSLTQAVLEIKVGTSEAEQRVLSFVVSDYLLLYIF